MSTTGFAKSDDANARAEYSEGAFTAWTDGSFWQEDDGTLVGWIEPDGVTPYPPLVFVIAAGAGTTFGKIGASGAVPGLSDTCNWALSIPVFVIAFEIVELMRRP